MSDEGGHEGDWGDLESLPKPKDGIPKWVWCCGCGCLIPIILMIVIGVYSYDFVQDGLDTEKAWSHLENVLPHESRVEGWNLEFGCPFFAGWEFYIWVHEHELGEDDKPQEPVLFATLMVAPADAIDELLETGEGTEKAEPFEITVQGRPVQGTRSRTEGAEAPFPFMPDPEDGASVVLDLTEKDGAPGGTQARVLLIVRQGSSDPITDDEIQQFLAPFYIGPDR